MFGLFELKTIVLCLRNASLRRTQEVGRLLDRSLLSDGLREVLHRGDRRAAVGALAATLAGTRPAFGELEAVYEEEGLKGLENGLMRVYLEEISREPLDPDVRAFFVLFTDLRNVVLLYKHLRWNLAGECRVIAGGSLAPARLHEVLAHRDEDGFHALVRRAAGLDAVPAAVDEGALETVLLRSVGRRLEATRREGGDVGVILSYIWRVYVQARNLALLHHGSGLDAATLGRELIL
jgi:vacuolar-type H+-ATPase subunit C/Vma6